MPSHPISTGLSTNALIRDAVRDFMKNGQLAVWVGVILLFGLLRLTSLNAYPPFIDETIHVFSTEKLAEISPFYNTNLARQGTLWAYALFAPTVSTSPIWMARVVTVLFSLIGLASVMSIARIWGGAWAGIFAGVLYGLSTYHYFFERLALSDNLMASVVLLSVAFASRFRYHARFSDALLCGMGLFVAFLMKTSALPYFALPVLAVLFVRPQASWGLRVRWGSIALGSVLVLSGAFFVGVGVLGYDLFGNAIGFAVSGVSRNLDGGAVSGLFNLERILANSQTRLVMLLSYWGAPLVVMSFVAMLWLMIKGRLFLVAVWGVPALALVMAGVQESRYWGAILALMLVGVGVFMAQLPRVGRVLTVLGVAVWGVGVFLPFAQVATQNPVALALDAPDVRQYIQSDATGFGLDETIAFLQSQEAQSVLGVLANCQGLRYRAWGVLAVDCPRLSSAGEDIEAIMRYAKDVYQGRFAVLEDSPYAPSALDGDILRVVPRPSVRAHLTIYALSR